MPRKVLIADDNKDAAETLGMFLELSGHEVHIANTGGRALELARDFRPQVAVLDIGMPDMSGYEVARRLRSENYGTPMTLIALTGWGHEEDKRKAHAAGFDHHMTKPIDPEDLERLIALGESAAGGSAPGDPAAGGSAPGDRDPGDRDPGDPAKK